MQPFVFVAFVFATAVVAVPTSTHTSPRALVSPIRAVEGAIYHLYLQNHGGKPQLGPEATEDYWTIGNTLLDNNSTLYLNVDRTVSTTYKPLSLGATATTTTWGLEGDTIIATNPRQNNFVACPTTNSSFWDLYLQEGNVVPSSSCLNYITIHLPCLC